MNRFTLLIIILLVFAGYNVNAQILNQSASWPSATWTTGGTYNAGNLNEEPSTGSTFSFDDDANTGTGYDSIYSMSPVIDLTSAHSGGETLITITSTGYSFNLLGTNEYLRIEYFDADASNWVAWYDLADNADYLTYLDCTNSTLTSSELDISGFTTTQLSGFRYRISYFDNNGWQYGFCIESPTITSVAPPSCPDPSALGASNITATSADLGWTVNGTETAWNVAVVLDGAAAPTTADSTVTTNPYTATGLTPDTDYDFYVQANCSSPAPLMISGVYDGQPTWASGSLFPKGVELYVVSDISDLSNYGIGSANNGGGTDGEEFTFPAVSATAGQYIYIASDSAGFYDFFGFNADYINGAANINGDDAIELFENGSVIDVFGNIDCDPNASGSTCPGWEYTDGWAYRNTGESSNGGVFTETNWTYSGIDELQGANDNTSSSTPFPLGTFTTTASSDLSAWVGPYSFTTLVSCPVPTGLSDSAVTTNSATVYWNAGGSETQWQLEGGPSGFTLGTGQDTIVNDSTFILTGLPDNTSFDVYVRAICGAGDTSVWTAVHSFSTLCNPYTVPYEEGFETSYTDQTSVGGCLSQESLAGTQLWTANSSLTSYNRTPRTGSFNAYLRYSNTDWIFIPIDLVGGTSYDAEVYARQDGSTTTNADITISYGVTASDADMVNTIVAATGLGNTYQQVKGTFVPATTGTYYIGIKGRINGSPWYISLDDISVKLTPSCLVPTALSDSAVTASTAEVYWVAGGSETLWLVEYGTSGFVLGTGTQVVVADSLASLSSLTANTTYDVYVRALCDTTLGSEDSSAWTSVYSFSTLCNPYTVPYEEGFETSYTDQTSVGGCLSQESLAGADIWTANSSLTSYNRTPRTGSFNAYLKYSNTDWIFIPIDLVGGTSYDAEVYARQDGNTTTNADITISYGVTASDADMVNTIVAATGLGNTYQQIKGTFVPATTGTYYIGIKGRINGSPWYISLDDISVKLTPACLTPTALADSAVTSSTAEVYWSAGGSETSWEVEYGTTGFTQGTGTAVVVADSVASLSGLTANTTYDVYVRSICGSDSSTWTSVHSFTTLCGAYLAPFTESFDTLPLTSPYTALPSCWETQTGPDYWDVTNDVTNDAQYLPNIGDHTTGSANYMWIDASSDITANEMITPEIDMSALTTPYAGFWFASNNTQTSNVINHTIALDVWDGSAWVNITTLSGNFTNWVEVAGVVPSGIPTVTKFRIYAIADGAHNSGYYYYNDLGVDDFFVMEKPSCATPNSLASSAVTANSATLSWTAQNGETLWLAEYGAPGFTLGTGTSVLLDSNPYTLTGLTTETDYEVYIRALCDTTLGSEDSSAWSLASTSFTTLASCPVPTAVSDSALTLTSAYVYWVAGGSETSWQVEYDTSGFTQGTGTTVIVTDSVASLTGLTANTDYDVYVRAICGTGDTSVWTSVYSFYTGYCIPSPSSTDGNGLVNVTMGAINNTTTTPEDYADYTSMVVDAPQSTILNISITVEYGYGMWAWIDWNDDFDFDDADEFQFLGETTTSVPLASSISVPATAPLGNHLIRIGGSDFNHGSGSSHDPCYTGTWGTFEDYTINVTPPPTCFVPTSVSDSAVTSSTADVYWTAGGSETSWQVEYGTSGFTQGTGTTVVVTDSVISLTGLTANTDYDVYVRAICGTGDTSAWTTVNTFTTLCAYVSTFPACESFVTAGGIPNCWSTYGSENWIVAGTWPDYGAAGQDNSGALGVDGSVPNGTNATLQSGYYDLSSNTWATFPMLSFDIFSNNTNNAGDNALVTIEITNDFGSTWNTLTTYQSDGGWVTVEQSLSAYQNDTISLRFVVDFSAMTLDQFYNDILLENVCVYEAPSCLAPTALADSAMTANSTSIYWTAGGSETSWQVEYGTSGFTQGTGTAVVVTDSVASLSGLSASTSYDVYVRAICNVGDSSTWVLYSFTTPCLSYMAPFIENFDTLALVTPFTDLPSCWEPQVGPDFWDVTDDVINTGHTYLPNIGDHTTGTTNYMWIDASSDILGNEMVTPYIDMSALTTPYAGFWFASNNTQTSNVVNHTIALDAWDGSAWVNVKTMIGNFPTWVEVADTLPAGIPTVTKFRIYAIADGAHNSSYYFYNDLGVDDFFVIEKPSCLTPTALGDSAITDSSASIYWTAGGSETQWQVEYGESGFVQGTGTFILVNSGADTTLLGLTNNTTYDVYVRGICAVGDSSAWAGPNSFTTLCGVETPYYFQPFDAFLPDACWSEADAGSIAAGPSSIGTSPWTGGTALSSNTARINIYGTGRRDWLLSPQFDLSLGGYEVLTDVAVTNWNNAVADQMGADDTVFLAYTEDGVLWNVLDTWTVEDTIPNVLTNYSSLIPSTGNMVQFGIFANSGTVTGQDYDFHVDNFIIRVAASCTDPSAVLDSAATSNSADVYWTAGGTETQWQVEYGVSGFALGTGTQVLVNTNSYTTLTGLMSGTDYDVYVRAICGTADTSYWTPVHTVSTTPDYCGGDIFTDTGGDAADYASNENETWTICPDNPGDVVYVNFTEFSSENSATGCFDGLTIYDGNSTSASVISPASLGAGTGNGIWCWDRDDATPSGTGDLQGRTLYSTDASGCLTFVFTSDGSLTREGWQAGVTCGPAPTCFAPFAFNLDFSGISTASVSWSDTSGTDWIVEYGLAGFTHGTGTVLTVSDTFTNLSGLSPSTDYEVYVRSYCGVGDSSFWVGPVYFTTDCAPISSLPACQDFIGLTGLPNCWSTYGSENWIIAGTWPDYGAAPADNSGIGVDGSTPNGSDATLQTPYYDMNTYTGTNVPQLSFELFSNNTNTPGDNALVTVEITNDFGATWTPILTSQSDGGWRDLFFILDSYSSDTIAFRFIVDFTVMTGLEYYNDIVINNVCVNEAPDCIQPSNFVTSNVEGTSITVSWSDYSGAAGFMVEYGETGFTPGTGTMLNTTDTFVNLTGTTALTTYDIYVQADCTTDTSTIGSFTFATGTDCNAATVNAQPVNDCVNNEYNIELNVSDIGDAATLFVTDGTDTLTTITSTGVTSVGPFVGGVATTIYILHDVDTLCDLSGTFINAPCNDDLCDAQPIVVNGDTVYGSNIGATAQVGEPVGACWLSTSDTASVWYSFVAPNNGSVTVSTDMATGTLDDTQIAVYQLAGNDCSEMDSLTALECDEDGGVVVNYNSVATLTGLNPGETYYVQVDGYGTANGTFGIVITTDCEIPTNPVLVSATETSIDLGWDENGAATSWVVEYGAPGFTPGTGTTVITSSNPYTLSGLTEGDEIQFTVRAICTSTDTSLSSVLSDTLSTLVICNDPTMVAVNVISSDSAEISWTDASGAGSFEVEYGEAGFIQGFGTVVTATSSPVILSGLDGSTDYDFYVRAVCDSANGDYSNWVSGGGFSTPVSCPAPYDIIISDITDSSATIAWSDTSGATNWQVEYGAPGFTPGSGTFINATTNPVTVNGLSEGTQYQFYVTSICGANDISLISDVSNTITTLSVGIISVNDKETVEVYAHKNIVYMKFDNVKVETADVQIFDVMGKEIVHQVVDAVGTQSLQVNNVATGIYVVKLEVDEVTNTIKVFLTNK